MARQDINPALSSSSGAEHKKRSALGIGITTLVTIIVVVLLTAFAVLSLVSARSNLKLSEMALTQTEKYYAADNEATVWYAELDAFAATLAGAPDEYEEQLRGGGYDASVTNEGELRVSKGFNINEHRTLMVTIAVND
ncbi:MAG: hypothetical protein LBP91_02935, partial [Coriobacteriales bacterium]|nr:hypothetical protein [Coriobacteriales bacterium]